MNDERRYFTLDEIRVKREDGKPKIRGHAAVFNVLSEDLGGFREKIDPEAFGKLEGDIRSFFNHDPMYVLGRRSAGTLKIGTDEKGLWFEADPPDTQWARDLLVSMERGDIRDASFAFRTITDAWEKQDEQNIRTLKKVQLMELGPVTVPAYPQADAAVRSFKEFESKQSAVVPEVVNLAAMRKQEELEAYELPKGTMK